MGLPDGVEDQLSSGLFGVALHFDITESGKLSFCHHINTKSLLAS